MKNKIVINLIIMFLCSGIVFSQGKIVSNDFGITLGLTEYQTIEEVLNNVKHRGMFPSVGFSFEKSNEISNHDVEFKNIYHNLFCAHNCSVQLSHGKKHKSAV